MSDSTGRETGNRLRTWTKLRADQPLVETSEGQLTTAAEDYRRIAVQIEQNLDFNSGTGKIIAITGPDPRSGKTLLSLNLSQFLARRGDRKVLLVEADLFRPSLCDYLEVEPGGSGLGDVLRHDATVDDVRTVIATGDLAPLICNDSSQIDEVDLELTIKGLRILHERNRERKAKRR